MKVFFAEKKYLFSFLIALGMSMKICCATNLTIEDRTSMRNPDRAVRKAQSCADKPGKYTLTIGTFKGKKKSCSWPKSKNKPRCNDPAAQEHCPDACGLCPAKNPSVSSICHGSCDESGGVKICTFKFKVNLYASELGYFTVDGCEGVMPTLGMEKGVTYIFDQGDQSNYYHPLGLAYYADGAHDDVDELEPVITPPGSGSDCEADEMCPAPMYIKGGEYLGEYSNNDLYAPLQGSDNFGLDDYEPEFFLDFLTWKTAGKYEIALKFDVDDFTQDIFYFCHIHQFMTGRIKFVDENGDVLQEENSPEIPYDYESPSDFDESCGTSGLDDFALPHKECPSTFVCGKPEGPVGDFATCLDAMNCAMTVGMTTNVNQDSAIALFNHQMIPHHQNAVNMCKALMMSGEVECDDVENEDDPHCVLVHLCYEIINAQNFQIQTMRGILEALGYDEEDDCKVPIKTKKNKKKSKKGSKRE